MKSAKINSNTINVSTNECNAIDNAYTAPERVLDCGPCLNELNQVDGPNHPTPPALSICGIKINIFTRCTIRNQFDI